MPLTQAAKDAAQQPAEATVAAIEAWPDDVPEKAPLLTTANGVAIGISNAVVPPPVPVEPIEPVAIADVVGGITRDFLYGGGPQGTAVNTWAKWTPGGEWRDAMGLMMGAAPFGSTNVPIGAKSASIDVSTLAAKSQTVQIRLQTPAALIQFGKPPLLVVTYTDGTTDTLQPAALIECNLTTTYLLVNRTLADGTPYFEVSKQCATYLRYQAPKPIASALLSIPVVKVYTGGAVQAMQFAHEWLPQPSGLVSWAGTPLFSSQSLAPGSMPGYLSDQIYGADGKLDRYNQLQQVTDDGAALECWLDPAQNNLLNARVGIFPEAQEAVLRYRLKILSAAATAACQSGKLPGWCCATQPDDATLLARNGNPFPVGTVGTSFANGGQLVNGKNGWSARMGYHPTLPNWPPGHPLTGLWGVNSYVYHPDSLGPGKTDYNGEDCTWTDYGIGALEPDTWHHVEQRLKINTPDQHDGEIEGRLNGELAYLRSNFMFRKSGPYTLNGAPYNVTTDLAIRAAWLAVYHGGHAVPLLRSPFVRIKEIELVQIS